MKKIFPFLMALLIIASCGKEKEEKDLTTLIVGVYNINGNQQNGTITVNKKDDSHVTIAIQDNRYEYPLLRSFSFTDVKVNSETSFTLNKYSYGSSFQIGIVQGVMESCDVNVEYTGTGTVSENSISLFVIETNTPSETKPCPEGYHGSSDVTVSGVRQ